MATPVVNTGPTPPRTVPNITKPIESSRPMASKADCCRPEHRSPAKMLSHTRSCCNGKPGAK